MKKLFAIVLSLLCLSVTACEKRLDNAVYDENGNMVKSLAFGDDGIPNGWYSYEYDTDAREIKMILYNIDGSVSYWHEYEYAEGKNPIKRTVYHADGTVNWWMTYEYDAKGKK